MEYKVRFSFDKDASVWIVTSEDIPGLVLENESYDTLLKKVENAAPELIELNHLSKGKNPAIYTDSRIKGMIYEEM